MPGKRITDHQVHKYKEHRKRLTQVAAPGFHENFVRGATPGRLMFVFQPEDPVPPQARELGLIRDGGRGNSNPAMVAVVKGYAEADLKPVADHLSKLLGTPVAFATECVGDPATSAAAAMKDGDVLVIRHG